MELAACSWVAPGTSWGAKVGIQFAYSHSIRKMGPKSGPGESLTPFRLNGFECSWVVAPGCFGCSWGASGCSWASSRVLLGSSWVFVDAPGPLAAKVGVQFAYSHSIDKMGPKSGPSAKILPRRSRPTLGVN